jgi:hypothetical protein
LEGDRETHTPSHIYTQTHTHTHTERERERERERQREERGRGRDVAETNKAGDKALHCNRFTGARGYDTSD